MSALDDNGAIVANGSATLHITFQGIGDNIVGFQCSLDRSTFSSCTTPFIANQLKAGVEHIFKVRAVNSFGKDATPARLTWSVLTPSQEIKNLIVLVKGIQNALIAQLKDALQFLDHKPIIKVGAYIEMNGFIKQVQGISMTGQITPSEALQLMNSAEAIQKAIRC